MPVPSKSGPVGGPKVFKETYDIFWNNSLPDGLTM